jgi:hypothetical protein
MLGLASVAMAGIPDLTLSSATTAAGSEASVYTLPNGNGRALDDARTSPAVGQSQPIDATVTLTLHDGNDDPIFLYPAEDMWLESSLGGLHLCPGGSAADFDTNINGQTTWSNAINGGGYTNRAGGERTIVMINGQGLTGYPLNIQWNSPDITGDLQVNLTDIVQFKNALTSGYQYYADLAFDQQLNLSDIVLMAQGLGSLCP